MCCAKAALDAISACPNEECHCLVGRKGVKYSTPDQFSSVQIISGVRLFTWPPWTAAAGLTSDIQTHRSSSGVGPGLRKPGPLLAEQPMSTAGWGAGRDVCGGADSAKEGRAKWCCRRWAGEHSPALQYYATVCSSYAEAWPQVVFLEARMQSSYSVT